MDDTNDTSGPAMPHRERTAGPLSPGRRLALGLVLAVGLSGCGGGGDTEAAPPDSPAPVVAPGTWVVLGSSTAAGVGADPGQGWTDLLAAETATQQVTLRNLARAGAVTYQALPSSSAPPPGRPAPDAAANIDRALALAPRLLLLAFPTNDAVAGYDAGETVANLSMLRQAAQARGAATLVLSTQPRAGLTAAASATLAETDRLAAARFGACFVDVRAALAGPDGELRPEFASGDGIHLNAAGHRALHGQLTAHIRSGRCVRLAAG